LDFLRMVELSVFGDSWHAGLVGTAAAGIFARALRPRFWREKKRPGDGVGDVC